MEEIKFCPYPTLGEYLKQLKNMEVYDGYTFRLADSKTYKIFHKSTLYNIPKCLYALRIKLATVNYFDREFDITIASEI